MLNTAVGAKTGARQRASVVVTYITTYNYIVERYTYSLASSAVDRGE
jgi:hypothetical protein